MSPVWNVSLGLAARLVIIFMFTVRILEERVVSLDRVVRILLPDVMFVFVCPYSLWKDIFSLV